MIKANELRVGNYVYYQHPTTNLLIHKIEWLDFKEINEFPDIYNEYHKPIPITEELLLKCGFGKGLGLYSQNPFTLSTNNNIDYEHTQTSTKIKYLHQLQNLYFAIKNEDLTIQL